MGWLRWGFFALALHLNGVAFAASACPPTPVQASASQAKDHGLLYRIGRDGLDSFVYGSLHIGRPEWANPGPKLRAALQRVDLLALELDLSDPATLQVLSQPPAHAPALKLTPALRARLDAQARAACLPTTALAGQHPLMELATYTVLAARWDGLDSRFGQEVLLSQWAQQHGLPIIALEDAASQQQALIPSDAKQALLSLQKGLTQLEQGRVRPVMLRLAQAWAQGDLATMENYARWCDCVADAQDRADFVRLNDARNPGLADAIVARHSQGQSVLAAVGALHLSGEQSLLKQLRRRGFVVERLHPGAD